MPFTDRTIVVTALTGVAAVLIKGETLHSALHVMCDHINEEMMQSWSDACLVIVDEISLADADFLGEIDGASRDLMECAHKPFGGVNIAFIRDFPQPEPVNQNPLYRDSKNPIWFECITNCIELDINHRAKADRVCANVLDRFRRGVPTGEDIDLINAGVSKGSKCPPKIQGACDAQTKTDVQ